MYVVQRCKIFGGSVWGGGVEGAGSAKTKLNQNKKIIWGNSLQQSG